MRKKLVCYCLALSVLLVFSAISTVSTAADYKKVGVQAGSTGDYSFTLGKKSAANTTGTLHLKIMSIINLTLINFNLTYSYLNGTTSKTYQTGNVSTGFYKGNITVLQLIAANLTVGDSLAIANTWKINQTAYKIVAGANRTLNHFYFSSGNANIYYDRFTGIMTELHLNWGPTIGWMNMTMTSTNLWSGGGGGIGGLSTTTLILIGGAAVVIIAAAMLLLRRRK